MVLFDLKQMVLEHESMDTKAENRKNRPFPCAKISRNGLHSVYQNKNHVILNHIQWTCSRDNNTYCK